MLKKAFAFITIILVSYLYLVSSTLFINEDVYAVTSLKSSSKIKTINVKPFNSEYGIYKNFEPSYNYDSLIDKLNAKLIYVEEVDGVKSLYYYAKNLPQKELVNGKIVNVHVAISLTKITVGSPIIYGSF